MSNWKLSIENIGCFRDKKEFILKEGINLIVGENATGKTSLINAIKLLNNLNLKEASKDSRDIDLTYQDFLNNKTGNASIKLSNEHIDYHLYISSPAGKITSYLDGKTPIMKNDSHFITDESNTIKFTYLDKNNNLMESIEYSGTVEEIKNEILKLSNIDNYELILNHVKELNFEYQERKEHEIKRLNDDRKEIELKIQENLNNLEELQKEMNEIQYDQEISDDLNLLKAQLKDQNQKYNNIRLKGLDGLIQDYNKTVAKLEKDKKKIDNLKNKKIEIENFVNLGNNIIVNEKKIEKYDSNLTNFKKQKDELNLRRYTILQQIQLLNDTVKDSEEDIICRHCLNPIDKKKINQKLEDLGSIKKEILENIRNIESEIEVLNKKRNKLSSLISDQKNIPVRLTNLNSEINNLQNIISVNEEKKKKLEKNIENQNQQLNKIQVEVKELHKKIIDLSSQDEEIKQKYTELMTKINLIKEENDILSSNKNLLVQKILILPENYAILIERCEILIKILNEYIENFYFDFIDNINSELKILLQKLEWNFKEVYIDDDLNLVINNTGGKPLKFKSLSDFEKKSIAILIMLIIKIKYYPDYPIFIIDEHLNSADSGRFVKFIPHLYEKILKSNVKLFIITSLPNDSGFEFVKDWENSQFEQLTVYYKN